MDFSKLGQAPAEVVPVVVLLVRAGVEEVNVTTEKTKKLSSINLRIKIQFT